MAPLVMAELRCHGDRSCSIVAGIGRLSAGIGSEAATARSIAVRTQGTPSDAPAQSSPPSVPPSSPTPSIPATPESPEEVAVAFVRTWARPDAAIEGWQARCQALSTQRFASELDLASSAAVPASRVVGDTEVLRRSEGAALVRIPTDGGAVHVALELTAAGWRVDGIDPEALGGPASAVGG